MSCQLIFRCCQIIQISLGVTVFQLRLPSFDLCYSERRHGTIGFYIWRAKLNSDGIRWRKSAWRPQSGIMRVKQLCRGWEIIDLSSQQCTFCVILKKSKILNIYINIVSVSGFHLSQNAKKEKKKSLKNFLLDKQEIFISMDVWFLSI